MAPCYGTSTGLPNFHTRPMLHILERPCDGAPSSQQSLSNKKDCDCLHCVAGQQGIQTNRRTSRTKGTVIEWHLGIASRCRTTVPRVLPDSRDNALHQDAGRWFTCTNVVPGRIQEEGKPSAVRHLLIRQVSNQHESSAQLNFNQLYWTPIDELMPCGVGKRYRLSVVLRFDPSQEAAAALAASRTNPK